MNTKLSRRQALHQGAGLGAIALASTVGCGKTAPKPLACTDTTGVSPADVQIRVSILQYVDVSTTPGKNCANCQQFIPGAAQGCGACKIIKGPVNPAGNCKSYIAKTSG